jgi:hypothetical protein
MAAMMPRGTAESLKDGRRNHSIVASGAPGAEGER